MNLGSPELLVLLFVPLLFFIIIPIAMYKHGKSVGDQEGYNRGYKEGQNAGLIREAVKARG